MHDFEMPAKATAELANVVQWRYPAACLSGVRQSGCFSVRLFLVVCGEPGMHRPKTQRTIVSMRQGATFVNFLHARWATMPAKIEVRLPPCRDFAGRQDGIFRCPELEPCPNPCAVRLRVGSSRVNHPSEDVHAPDKDRTEHNIAVKGTP